MLDLVTWAIAKEKGIVSESKGCFGYDAGEARSVGSRFPQ